MYSFLPLPGNRADACGRRRGGRCANVRWRIGRIAFPAPARKHRSEWRRRGRDPGIDGVSMKRRDAGTGDEKTAITG